MRIALASLALAVTIAAPAQARPGETEVRAVIAKWYVELGKVETGRAHSLAAPGFIEASPHLDYIDNGSAALGPVVYTSLAATALEFRYDIDSIAMDARFAKVRVWERGYFYAPAAQKTYERAASTIFLLERQSDGRWLILAHQSDSIGIPPNRVTDPMPDLRQLYYATQGRGRDPAEDARNAARF